MTEREERLERDLEPAEATRREVLGLWVNRSEPGWVTNRRANIYAVDAEIARLRALLRREPTLDEALERSDLP